MSRSSKSSGLPSRYDDVLNQRFAEAMTALRAEGATALRQPRRRSWKLVAASIGLGLLVTAMRLSPARTRSTVPFAPTNTVQVMGLSQSPAEFLPPPASTSVSQPPSPARPTAAALSSQPAKRSRGSAAALHDSAGSTAGLLGIATAAELSGIERTDAGTVAYVRAAPSPAAAEEAVLFDEDRDTTLTITAEREDEPRRVVNLGARFQASLVYPVRTGASPVPVTARIDADVKVGDETAIKQGSLLVGSAIATRDSDRVQIGFQALVQDGITSRFVAVALGSDGEMGIPGKLIRKASGGRRWAGRAAGAVGSALSLDLARRTSGLTGTAARELAADIDRDLDYFERHFGENRSDKVVEAAGGALLVVSLAADWAVR